MSERFKLADNEVIDVGRAKPRRWRRWVLGALVLLLFILSRTLGIYLSAAWFSSLGFSSVYWYIFKLKLGLFLVFLVATAVLLRGAFWLLERHFKAYALEKRTIVVNNQPVQISPERFVRPASWIIAILFALFYGLAMKGAWQTFALYFNQAQVGTLDPIFHKPFGVYLFSLPFYDLISSWLITLSFVVLCASIIYSLLAAAPKATKENGVSSTSKRSFSPVSVALAAFLVILAWQTYLSRFPYLWE